MRNPDLYAYGIEGTHWEKTPENPRGILNINDPATDINNYQTGDDWKIGFIDMIRYATTTWPLEADLRYTTDEAAINSIAGVFFFDASPVSTEYANLQAEAATVMTPIVMGVVPYDEAYQAAIERLKVAGLDAVVAEYQKQLDAFVAAQ